MAWTPLPAPKYYDREPSHPVAAKLRAIQSGELREPSEVRAVLAEAERICDEASVLGSMMGEAKEAFIYFAGTVPE